MRTIAILALGCLLAVPAGAAQMRCSSSKLSSADSNELDRAMALVLPAGATIDTLPLACANADRAYAWVDTEIKSNPDGVREWWSLWCSRERGPWTCLSPKLKQELDFEQTVAGHAHRVTVAFGPPLRAADARKLVIQSLRLFSSPTEPAPSCSDDQTPILHESHWEERIGDDDPARQTKLSTHIESRAEVYVVYLVDGAGPRFEFATNKDSAGEYPLRCWSEWL